MRHTSVDKNITEQVVDWSVQNAEKYLESGEVNCISLEEAAIRTFELSDDEVDRVGLLLCIWQALEKKGLLS